MSPISNIESTAILQEKGDGLINIEHRLTYPAADRDL